MDGTTSFNAAFGENSYTMHCGNSEQLILTNSPEIQNNAHESSIYSFVSKLNFKVDDGNRKAFFDELEATLNKCSEEKIEDNAELYKFFVKYSA